VIYTAHGFHFYKGAPDINWIMYYPAEWFLSHITDVLITINHEDYARARALHAERTVMIPGVGLDTEKFESAKTNFEQKRKDFGIPLDSFLIMSVGELNENKNHRVIIRAIAGLKEIKPYYLICGEGPEKERLQKLAQRLNVENQVIFGGLRSDIHELLKIADCFAFPSKREGLGIAALEAMAAGLPIITSNSGGITEYSEDGKTGFVCRPDDVIGFAETIRKVAEDKVLAARMSAYNRQAAKKYDIRNVNRTMTEIYESVSQRKSWNVCGERERTE
jgi:glycosyltransferase involved in cell wall biosynthesis